MKRYRINNLDIISFWLINILLITNFFVVSNTKNLEPFNEEPNENIVPSSSSFIPNNFTKISEYDNNFGFYQHLDIFVQGNLAYLACGPEGLNIINISDTNNPELLHQIHYGYNVLSVFVEDNIAFLATGKGGLEIVNITDISKPVHIGRFKEYYTITYVQVLDGYAYLGTFYSSTKGGLVVLDISSLTCPNKIFSYTYSYLGFVNDIAIANNLVCVVGDHSSLFFDNTNPYKMKILEPRLGYKYIKSIMFVNDILYAVSDVYGIIIFDVSNINDLQELSRIQGNSPNDIFVMDNIAYVVSKTNGLILYDVTNTSGADFLSQNNNGGDKYNIWVTGNNALVLDNMHFLQIFDISDSNNPTILVNFTVSGYTEQIATKDNIIFLAENNVGVEILNISDVSEPSLLTTFDINCSCVRDVAIQDNILYIADELYGLVIANVSDIDNISYLNNWSNGGLVNRLFVQDSFVFLVDEMDGLEIVDISNLSSLKLLYTYTKTSISDVCVNGNSTFLSIRDTGFDILDISNKTNPIVIESYADTGSAESLFVNNSMLYLADGNNGLEIYDITDLDNPQKLTIDLDISYAGSVTVDNELIVIAGGDSGVILIQDNEGTYTQFETINDGGQAEAVIIRNSIIFLADGYDNFEIIGIDSDGDDLADTLETIHGTNPLEVDSDFDLLNDGVEVLIYNLNPLSNDTDNDNMDDSFEVNNKLNPKDVSDAPLDPDIDDLTNVEEYTYNTNPRMNDTDNDYLLDGEEVKIYFTNPTKTDTDMDGWGDGWEIYYETDPLDPKSYPDLESIPTGPPPSTPWKTGMPYYVYLAIIGGLALIGIIVYISLKTRKPNEI